MNTFRMTYDGPALQDSQMDVRDLAPALLAVGSLLEAASSALYGDRVKPQVDVRGSFKTGSFGVDFSLVADWVSRIKDMMAGEDATAAANALALLGALGWSVQKAGKPGLFTVLAWLKGRPIERVALQDHLATLHVQGELLEIEIQVLTLLRDVSVRRGCEKILQPMDNPGITRLIKSMGFQRLFELHEDACAKPGCIRRVPLVEGSEQVVKEKVLEANRVLMGLSEENRARFKDLMVVLERS